MNHVISGLAIAAIAASASAQTVRQGAAQPFFPVATDANNGDLVTINGFADDPTLGSTIWGTHAGQGMHTLGGFSQYEDAGFPGFTIDVTSNATGAAGSITFDFTAFAPGDFENHGIDILGIKDPGAAFFIDSVGASQGVATTDGFAIRWDGFGADLAVNPVLTISWTQVPAPGAAALLGLAGLASARRRR